MSKSSVLVNWFLVRAVPGGGKEKIICGTKKLPDAGDTSGNFKEREGGYI
jgi:hypothetical protein